MGDADPETGSPVRDWSQLPPDLLVSVLGLLEIRDLFACAAVSVAWRAACSAARRLGLWPDRGPYLVYSSADGDRGTATLHNISTGKSFHVALPDPPFSSRYIVGSSHGWLVTADETSNLHLLNPVTGAQIALPPPDTMIGVDLCFYGGVHDRYCISDLNVKRRRVSSRNFPQFLGLKKTRLYLYEKAVLSSDPSSGDCTVLLKHRPWEHLSFARVGVDNEWSWLDAMERCDHYHDFFYNDNDGLFYAIRANGEIHTIDLRGPSPEVKVIYRVGSSDISYSRYLVQAPWGDLLRIRRLYGIPLRNTSEEHHLLDAIDEVAVGKVDLTCRKVTRMKNLRDHMLFLGFNSTVMLRASDFPNLTPNCAYMTNDNTELIYHNPGSGRKLACVNLENGSFSDLPVSDSQLDWPPPIWFIPHVLCTSKHQ